MIRRINMGIMCLVLCHLSFFTFRANASGDLIPEYARMQLDNGLEILLLEHHEIPIVNFELLLRTGSIADPKDKEGLADVTMSLLRKGTKKHSAEALAEEFDFLGARLSLGANLENCSITAQFLKKDLEAGLALLTEMLTSATLPKKEFRKTIDLRYNALVEAKDNPRQVIRSYYQKFLFDGHPYGRPVGGTETSVSNITRKDAQRFFDQHVRPNNAILAIVGDFDAADLKSKIEHTLNQWKRGEDLTEVTIEQPKAVVGRRVLLVDAPDAVQTYFYIGNVGVSRTNADQAPLDIVNTVFGGRFTSWLMEELRTKRGLTYSAGSRFVRHREGGSFYVSSFTRTATTETTIDLAFELLGRLHKEGLTKEELSSAKNYIRGQYPPRYETAGELASAMIELEFYELGRETINQHTDMTDAVSLSQSGEVIDKYYPLDDVAIVMIGPALEIETIAKKYGKVQRVKISDPGF